MTRQPHDCVLAGDRLECLHSSQPRPPLYGFRAGGSGNITGKSELWTNNLGADVPTPTTDGKYIYVLVDTVSSIAWKLQQESRVPGKRIEHGTYSSSPLWLMASSIASMRRAQPLS